MSQQGQSQLDFGSTDSGSAQAKPVHIWLNELIKLGSAPYVKSAQEEVTCSDWARNHEMA